jgi:hypothetical protein
MTELPGADEISIGKGSEQGSYDRDRILTASRTRGNDRIRRLGVIGRAGSCEHVPLTTMYAQLA